MTTLYEIDKAIDQIIETGFAFDEETGEITYDDSDLEELNEAFADKLNACGIWIKNQRSLANAIRDEEKSLAERRKRIERKVEKIEGYILDHIDRVGGKFESPEVGISTRKSTKVNIYNAKDIPEIFIAKKIEERPDKERIRKALKSGKCVPGAELIESLNVSIK